MADSEAQTMNWQHILIEGAIYLVPTLGVGYLGYRKLLWVLSEYRPHLHEEEKGEPLYESGIRYPRTMNGGK